MTAATRRGALVGVGASVLLAMSLTGCGSNPAEAVTVLQDVHAAVVRDVAGRTTPAYDGQRLQAGDDVRTTTTQGSATLVAGARRVLVGPQSTLTVLDGTHAELRQGSALLLGRSGPPLSVAVGEFTVEARDATVARITRGYATTVGVYTGSARLAPSVGRGLVITGLHQGTVSGRAMPVATSPLRLKDDAWDQRAAPELVAYDNAIKQAVAGLPATRGTGGTGVVPAAYLTGAAASADRLDSESVLRLVLAKASTLKVPEGQRYQLVSELRNEGGSWAVVAGLVDAPSSRYGPALESTINKPPPPTPSPGPSETVIAPPLPPRVHSAAPAVPSPRHSPTPKPTRSTVVPRSPSTPASSPPPAGLLAPLNPLVDDLLSLLSLQPSPDASPAPGLLAPRAQAATPAPLLPAVTGAVTGVVSGLLTAGH